MRIVHVLGYYGNYQGGIQNYVHEITKRQKKQGHDVKIITSNIKGNQKKIDDVPIIRCKSWFSASRVPFSPSLIIKLLNEKCDVIHAHLPLPFWDLAVSLKKLIHRKTKLIVNIHNYSPRTSRLKKRLSIINDSVLIRPAISLSNSIITTTKVFADSLRYQIPKKKNFIIPLGVDLNKFSQVGKRDKNLILFVGRLIPEKGLHILIEAVKKLRKDNKKIKLLAVCSDAYDFNNYEKRIIEKSKEFDAPVLEKKEANIYSELIREFRYNKKKE